MILTKYKLELIIFLAVFIVYGFFTSLKITHLSFENIITAAATDYYFQIANNLINHFSFSLDGSSPTALRMPGYPFFLAVAFKILRNWWAVLFLQNAIAGLSAVILYSIAKKWLSPLQALLAAGIWAFEPYSIDIPSQFLNETLYTFFLLLVIFLFIQYKNKIHQKKFILIIALSLAALTYIKPISLFLPIIFLVAINYPLNKTKIYHALIFLIIFFSFLFPWLLRNYLIFGTWQLSSDNSSSFYTAALFTRAQKEGLPDVNREKPEKSEFPGFSESGNLTKTTSQFQNTVKIIISDPLNFTKVYLKYFITSNTNSSWWGSIRNLVQGTSGKINYHKKVADAVLKFDKNQILNFSTKEIGALIIMASGIIFWSIILILSIIGIISLFKIANQETRPFLILLTGIIIYLLFIGNIALGDIIRYRFPASPLIIIFAVYGLSALIQKFNYVK